MKKAKQHLLAKYKKEALILMTGISLVTALLVNLQSPKTKRSIATNFYKETETLKNKTQSAASKVEEEQAQQSVLLSKFKTDYTAFVKAKNCFTNPDCDSSLKTQTEYERATFADLSLKLENLNSLLTLNWFRLSAKVKNEVVSSITLEDNLVKKQVIELLLSLSIDESKHYVPLVLEHVIDRHNAKLTAKAFEFLKRTATPKNEVQTAKRVIKAIETAEPQTAKEMSQELTTIVSPNTSEIFKEALSTLPKQAALNKVKTPSLSRGLALR